MQLFGHEESEKSYENIFKRDINADIFIATLEKMVL